MISTIYGNSFAIDGNNNIILYDDDDNKRFTVQAQAAQQQINALIAGMDTILLVLTVQAAQQQINDLITE